MKFFLDCVDFWGLWEDGRGFHIENFNENDCMGRIEYLQQFKSTIKSTDRLYVCFYSVTVIKTRIPTKKLSRHDN